MSTETYIQFIGNVCSAAHHSLTPNNYYKINDKEEHRITIIDDNNNRMVISKYNKLFNSIDLKNCKKIRYIGTDARYTTLFKEYPIIQDDTQLFILDNTNDMNNLYEIDKYSPNFENRWEYINIDFTNDNNNTSNNEENNFKTTGENKMRITNPILINGTNVEKMDDNTLIESIKQEETSIKDLESIKATSKKIAAKIKEHNSNITKLVKILDSRK